MGSSPLRGSLLPNAVNELLRFDFGATALPRYALNDFEFRGKQIKKGQLMMLNFAGAHRDPHRARAERTAGDAREP